ncbi:MAG: response regulator transcription factor [Sphingobacteriales bacterium]|nr:MAG: response regulator transcription factor [Sphingobacteriales bacterium]
MEPNEIKILIADDEPDVLEFVRYNLQKENYTVITAPNGLKAIEMAKKHVPQLIILDIMMPELDGMQACKEMVLLPELKDTILVFLTARSEEFTQVMALDLGADDYITKPIRPRLLVSKIKSLLRRFQKVETTDDEEAILKVSDLIINKTTHSLTMKGQPIELPRKEFALLYLLASKPGRVFNREEILNKVWGTDVIVNDRTIDVHIRKLREKLGKGYIKTLKGVGYKFKPTKNMDE